MSTTTRRSAALWLVGAALVGGVAAVLHVLRSDLGGAHTSLGLEVSAWLVTALAALMLYHGVVVAAQAQDAAAPPEEDLSGDPVLDPARVDPDPTPDATPDPTPDLAAGIPERADAEAHETYTFKRGKRIGNS
ncbi:hypothetical protein [Intrasporangium sp. YIM S08009]|uniref:hypothetical protein n=1 Tax=Intrasporangium zincisolvens TaxID=3080018 RepID=UPI002B0619AE|nr:hypothetical protein [Intrasporangium sp. YIM S08009]